MDTSASGRALDSSKHRSTMATRRDMTDSPKDRITMPHPKDQIDTAGKTVSL
jgi:hypothetical protein